MLTGTRFERVQWREAEVSDHEFVRSRARRIVDDAVATTFPVVIVTPSEVSRASEAH